MAVGVVYAPTELRGWQRICLKALVPILLVIFVWFAVGLMVLAGAPRHACDMAVHCPDQADKDTTSASNVGFRKARLAYPVSVAYKVAESSWNLQQPPPLPLDATISTTVRCSVTSYSSPLPPPASVIIT
jgi:hypothetical protein